MLGIISSYLYVLVDFENHTQNLLFFLQIVQNFCSKRLTLKINSDILCLMLLGIDFGDSRTGLAISSGVGDMALPLYTIFEKSHNKIIDEIISVIK
ncbi:Holliday junction resolvase RuvX, partial [Treponema sp. R6D11]